MIRKAREVNDSRPDWVIRTVREATGAHLMESPDKTASDIALALYGLTFKPDIDDLRESPAVKIAKRIISEHAGQVVVVEPNIHSLPAGLEGAGLEGLGGAQIADIHALPVHHREFTGSKPASGRIIDTRRVW